MSPTIRSGLVRHRLHQRLHQQDVDHRGLIDDQQVAIERIVLATPEPAALRVYFQQPVDGLSLEAAGLGHALRSAAGWFGVRLHVDVTSLIALPGAPFSRHFEIGRRPRRQRTLSNVAEMRPSSRV
jgi:hypothetical protein